MLQLIVTKLRVLRRLLAPHGFSMMEISITMAIGGIGLYLLSSQTNLTFQNISQVNKDVDLIALESSLDSNFMTKASCGVSLGIMNPQLKTDPSSIEVIVSGEPAPITFSVPMPPDTSKPSNPPALSFNKAIELKHPSGANYLTKGGKFGKLTIEDINFFILPTPIMEPLPGSGLWVAKGQIVLAVSYPNPKPAYGKTTKYLYKDLTLKLAVIPTKTSNNENTLTGKVVGCSSTEGLKEGAAMSAPNPLKCPNNGLFAIVPDENGSMGCKAVACDYGFYISGRDSQGGVICTKLPDCRGVGEGIVMLPDGSGNLIPKCKILTCPAGQLPTGKDSDGYISSCDLNSNYFIKCTGKNDWQCTTNSSGNLVTRQTFWCDTQGNPAKICIEDCSKKFEDICGCPLNGAGFSLNNRPRMTIDCLSSGSCALNSDCSVPHHCRNTYFDSVVVENNKYYCRTNWGNYNSAPSCGSWNHLRTLGNSRTCGIDNLDWLPVHVSYKGSSGYNDNHCRDKAKEKIWWGHWPPAQVTATVDSGPRSYVTKAYCHVTGSCSHCDCCACWCGLELNSSPYDSQVCYPDYHASYCY